MTEQNTPHTARRARHGIFLLVAYVLLEITLYVALPRRPAAVDRLRYFFNGIPTPAHSILQWKIHDLLTQPPQPYDVVFLGDCSCMMNVNPAVVERATGLKGLNLGTIGFHYIDGHIDLLDLYLKRFPRPRLLVYYTTPWQMGVSYASIQRIGTLSKVRDWAGIPTGNPLSHWPSYRAFTTLKAWACRFAWAPGAETARRGAFPSDTEFRNTMRQTQGFMVDPQRQALTEEKVPELHPDFIPGLKRLLRTAQSQGFPVLLVMNTVPDSARSQETDMAYARLRTALEPIVKSYSGAHLADSWLRYYPAEGYTTPHDLLEAGTEKNSREVAQLIKNIYE